jgi:hypothetical protein
MYSFAQRPDTRVVDEPLYGHYLKVTGAPHPGAAEVMAAMTTDGDQAVRESILGACDRPVLYVKCMAHHLIDLDLSFVDGISHAILVRDPRVDPAMLSWPAGPRPEDGVWAKYWYDNVHKSTGFAPYRPKTEPFPAELRPLLQDCMPLYRELHGAAIRAKIPVADESGTPTET